jgi:hypothetical protein
LAIKEREFEEREGVDVGVEGVGKRLVKTGIVFV